MAKRRIIAHCMHEHELALANTVVQGGVSTEGTVVGEIDDADVPRLKAAGIVVQQLDEPQPVSLRRAQRAVRPMGRPGGWVVAAGPPPPRPGLPPIGLPPANVEVQYRVRLAGPLAAAWRRQLDDTGATIREAESGNSVRMLMRPATVAALQGLPFVLGVEPWNVESTSEAEDVMAAPPIPGTAMEMVAYDVLLVSAAQRQAVTDWLEARHIPIAAAAADKIRIYVPEDSTAAEELQQRTDWVLYVEPYIQPMLHNERARVILGADAAAGPIGGLQGSGETVGVADTGIDQAHQDFAGRLANVIPLGRMNDATDPHGHGTHVAGSLCGDGSASGGQVRGVAPGARLVFQSVMDAAGGLRLPFRLQDLFQEAYGHGARIHNNSWGSATGSSYRINCREVDEFVYDHKDMLIVISAGNEGTAVDPPMGVRRTAQGFVDWLSIGSPATAKNALTVGASRSDRTNGGYSQLTYGSVWPQDFPQTPIKDELVSKNTECISAFSSRGPCDDYRIKPDVVAPGTDILSCRSQRAPLRNFWGPYPASPQYAYMGGTSMAAPLVAGCATLVREYFIKRRAHQPSAALLKATLINGTRWLKGTDAVADHANQPNYHQGFGCVHLPSAIVDVVDPAQQLQFIDNWNDAGSQLSSDQRRRYRFTVPNGGGPLRLCLVYTDPPGRAVQNNLNVLLEVPGGGAKLFGNMQLPNGLNQPDAVNNVEVIRIDNAPAGDYLVQIMATSILRGPQDFALVVTGGLSTPLQPI